jgi:hypothetical protein
MEKEKVEHELDSNCLDCLLTLKVERKNYIEILNTIERRFAELGRQILIPLMWFASCNLYEKNSIGYQTTRLAGRPEPTTRIEDGSIRVIAPPLPARTGGLFLQPSEVISNRGRVFVNRGF